VLPAPIWLFVAGILESPQHREADPHLPIGGGVRVVATDDPKDFAAHLAPGERFFLVPRWKARYPIHYDLWPLNVGAAEIHVATSIWPERLERWGTWEAEKYFREQVLPLIEGAHNRPPWWWQEPQLWAVDGEH
jgi:hypothetical protein